MTVRAKTLLRKLVEMQALWGEPEGACNENRAETALTFSAGNFSKHVIHFDISRAAILE